MQGCQGWQHLSPCDLASLSAKSNALDLKPGHTSLSTARLRCSTITSPGPAAGLLLMYFLSHFDMQGAGPLPLLQIPVLLSLNLAWLQACCSCTS